MDIIDADGETVWVSPGVYQLQTPILVGPNVKLRGVTMNQRDRFIEKLDEVIELAGECGELPAKGILYALVGALKAGGDMRLFSHVMVFSRAEIERLAAALEAEE